MQRSLGLGHGIQHHLPRPWPRIEVLHPTNAVALGIDCNRAHTQGRGTYHYHGVPTGLLWELIVAKPDSPMHLLGYAADGFPIYGPECSGDTTDSGCIGRRHWARNRKSVKSYLRQCDGGGLKSVARQIAGGEVAAAVRWDCWPEMI